MLGYISGIIKDIGISTVIIDNNGIGYEISVSRFCLNTLKQNEQAKIYTYMYVREDEINLFGFYSLQEKDMFLRLVGISGIGPKVALGVLSGLALNDLCIAIASGDAKSLSGIKGIGKKTAERIVLELKDKLNEEFSISTDNVFVQTDNGEDAILALVALGYSKQESINAVKNIDPTGKSVEEIVKAALKRG